MTLLDALGDWLDVAFGLVPAHATTPLAATAPPVTLADLNVVTVGESDHSLRVPTRTGLDDSGDTTRHAPRLLETPKLPTFTDIGTVAKRDDNNGADATSQVDAKILGDIPLAGALMGAFSAIAGASDNSAGMSPQQMQYLADMSKKDSAEGTTNSTLRTAAIEGRDASKIVGASGIGSVNDNSQRVGGRSGRIAQDDGTDTSNADLDQP